MKFDGSIALERLLKYSKLCKKFNRIPTNDELSKVGITPKMVNNNFFGFQKMHERAIKEYPSYFNDNLKKFDRDINQTLKAKETESEVIRKYAFLVKKLGYIPNQHELSNHGFPKRIQYVNCKNLNRLYLLSKEKYPECFEKISFNEDGSCDSIETKTALYKESCKESMMKKTKEIYIKKYADLVKSLGKIPTSQETRVNGITFNNISYVGGMDNLLRLARENYPEYFDDIIDESIFTKDRLLKMEKKILKHKRFLITTAVAECDIDENFFASMKQYCKENNAMLLILPAAREVRNLNPILKNENIVINDIHLNKNFFINTIKLSPKQIDPITSLLRIGQRNGSFVFASPKQRLFFVPTTKNKLPHALITPGAITLAHYKSNSYQQMRLDRIADNDHIMGGLVVEIKDEHTFHFRHIENIDKDGSFYDLNKHYTPKGSSIVTTRAMVMGDLHSAQKDPVVFEKFLDIANVIKPEEIILHDVFDGLSINHHNAKKHITRARIMGDKKITLENEIEILRSDLLKIMGYTKRTIIVKSNHDEWLNQLIESGDYMYDPINFRTISSVVTPYMNGEDPLKFLVDIKGENLVWLTRRDDYFIKGRNGISVQVGAHGDRGANGARGSMRSVENAFGSAIVGHGHAPQRLRKVDMVGTCQFLNVEYNEGDVSSWVNSLAIMHQDGSRQIINVINGQWRS